MASGKGNVLQDLEFAIRAKGGMTREEDTRVRVLGYLPTGGFVLASGLGSYLGWFGLGIGTKLFGIPPMPGLKRFGLAAGCAFIMGKGMYHATTHACAAVVVNSKDERMKMELANIILTKHSDDPYLVGAVKRNFFAEHLFDDLHQDRPLFRWHPRRSNVDSPFVERVKEIEASKSDDEARSVSRQTTVNIRSFGDLMDDPLACILGSPGGGDVESNNPPENSGTVLKRSELRARRTHHHHRHPDKLAAL